MDEHITPEDDWQKGEFHIFLGVMLLYQQNSTTFINDKQFNSLNLQFILVILLIAVFMLLKISLLI